MNNLAVQASQLTVHYLAHNQLYGISIYSKAEIILNITGPIFARLAFSILILSLNMIDMQIINTIFIIL